MDAITIIHGVTIYKRRHDGYFFADVANKHFSSKDLEQIITEIKDKLITHLLSEVKVIISTFELDMKIEDIYNNSNLTSFLLKDKVAA